MGEEKVWEVARVEERRKVMRRKSGDQGFYKKPYPMPRQWCPRGTLAPGHHCTACMACAPIARVQRCQEGAHAPNTSVIRKMEGKEEK